MVEWIGSSRFIKLDVQAFELKVLKGAESAFKSCAAVLIECNLRRFSPAMPTLVEVISWMDQWGYMPHEIVEVLRRPFDGVIGRVTSFSCERRTRYSWK
jgi:hypothetical protein